MKKIRASAPGKLMLFGEHAVVYGRPCLVTAVDKRISVSVSGILGDIVWVDAPDVGIKNYQCRISDLGKSEDVPKGVRFIERALINFFEKYGVKKGLRIETKSDFSSKFGFGSSSAVTVALLAAVTELFSIKISKKELFDLAYKTVLDVQGVGSGFDLAAAIWGGTLYFKKGGKKIEPILVKEWPLVVGYTGIKADTAILVGEVAKLYTSHKEVVENIFDDMEKIVNQAKREVEMDGYNSLGELMNINQGLLDAIGVNTFELNNLIIAARESGAWGAKLSGAGGGDCMICLVANNKRLAVEKAITGKGGTVLKVKTNALGVKIE